MLNKLLHIFRLRINWKRSNHLVEVLYKKIDVLKEAVQSKFIGVRFEGICKLITGKKTVLFTSCWNKGVNSKEKIALKNIKKSL